MISKLSEFRLTFLVLSFWLGAISAFNVLNSSWVFICGYAAMSVLSWFKFPQYRYFQLLLTIAFILAFGNSFIRVKAIQGQNLPTSATIYFQVLEDPKLVNASFGLAGEKELKVFVDADFNRLEPAPLLLTVRDLQFSTAKISSIWKCQAEVEKQSKPRKYAGYGECTTSPVLVEPAKRIHYIADAFREGLRKVTSDRYESDAAALLPGLVLGDTSAQTPRMEQALQMAGLGHLTAVSGANVAIVLLGLEFLLRLTKFNYKTRLIVLALGAVFFMVVVRPSPSVVRATAMALIGLISIWYGKPKVSLMLLNLSAITLLALDPFLATSIGFQLSVAATFGLIVLPKVWQVQVDASFWWKAFSTAAAAGLATVPILIAADLNPTFATIPANMLAEILVAPATLGGVIAAVSATAGGLPLVGGILYFIAQFVADFSLFPAAAILLIANWAEKSIFQVSLQSQTGLITLSGVAVAVFFMRKWRWQHSVIAGTLSVGLSVLFWANGLSARWGSDWDVAVCDVGQGDATVLHTSANSAIVIDAGPDEMLLSKCLDALEIEKVNLFVASHFHADHVAAVSALRDYHLEAAWFPNSMSPIAMSEFVTTQLAGVPSVIPKVGEVKQVGDWVLKVLQAPLLSETDDGSDINNASLVLIAQLGNRQVLFTGDIEVTAQTNLIRSYPLVDFDVVKVPHHGSAAQNPDFALWSKAELGWISAGADNPYGHPAPETIGYYRRAEIVLYSTIDCGQIGFNLAATKLEVRAGNVCQPL